MSKVSILHLSDIHWNSKNSESLAIIRDEMIEDIRRQQGAEGLTFDLVLFTGDLVLAGENRDDFDKAHELILKPILNTVELDENRLFICPGNHDVSRKLVRDSGFIEKGLKLSLNSVDAVNSFLKDLDSNETNTKLAMSRMANFEDYLDKKFQNSHCQSGTVKVYKFEIRDNRIGIASFDNSWRASGEAGGIDRNNLILESEALISPLDRWKKWTWQSLFSIIPAHGLPNSMPQPLPRD